MGDTVCALKSLSYISEWWNWKGNRRGSISVCFKHTDNFTQVNIHKISLLLQESRELFYIFLKDSKPMFCKIYLFPPVKEQYHKDGASVPPCQLYGDAMTQRMDFVSVLLLQTPLTSLGNYIVLQTAYFLRLLQFDCYFSSSFNNNNTTCQGLFTSVKEVNNRTL